ncbi:DMT family transporter [Inhella gelatinilytica]|uniref:DMT family transporter n=1 Tax=Inhella gelatinilytica TaxID=2795030 RepID=A0A931IXI3_9BURK|nr:DMT family transporter [Inhella gelatinilytica]MBH9553722.1 DMT family transporter [Inhella gelatinilytica]
MPTWFLFLAPTLIWASTWHVILYQLASPVPPLTSVGWRFALAAVLLGLWSRFQGHSLRIPRQHHALLVAAGIVQYGGNYWAVYEAERHIPSGLVAVLFALMVFGNALGAWWAFGQKSSRRFLLTALGGVAGVALVFWPEIALSTERPQAAWGLLIGLFAVGAACLGNVLTLTLTRRGVPLPPLLTWSMGYGALFLLSLSVLSGSGLPFDTRPAYWLSLIYLSVLGSAVAFVLYFQLAARQGPARAALMGVVIPVIALGVSAILEGWKPTPLAALGMLLCVSSVALAQRPTPTASPPLTAARD